jgi:hypothetical protein
MVMKMLEQKRRTIVHIVLIDAAARGGVVEMPDDSIAGKMKAR